jgi:hypothetical protein
MGISAERREEKPTKYIRARRRFLGFAQRFLDSRIHIRTYKPQQAKVLFALTVHLCGIASLLQSLMKSRRVLLHSSQRIPVHLLFITTKAWY